MALKISKSNFETDYTYIPVSERGEAKPFSISFKRIPLDKLALIQDEAITIKQSGTYALNINSQYYNILKMALTGWENITEGKKEIKFRIVHGVASDESIEILPADIRAEIASVILDVSRDPSNADAYLKDEVEIYGEEEDGEDK